MELKYVVLLEPSIDWLVEPKDHQEEFELDGNKVVELIATKDDLIQHRLSATLEYPMWVTEVNI